MRRLFLLLIAVLCVLVAVSLVSAQTGEWDLGWSTIDGGGATSLGLDRYILSGSIGQPDVGNLSGGVYTLQGGFWGVAASSGARCSTVYLPLLLK